MSEMVLLLGVKLSWVSGLERERERERTVGL